MSKLLRFGLLLALLTAGLALSGIAVAAVGDVDNDAIADESDNCQFVYNNDQQDFDADGIGNTCDPTPGVPEGGSLTYIYHRDATTGGPLAVDPLSPRCVSASLVGFDGANQSGVNTTGCYRRFTFGIVYSTTQRVVFTVLQDPPDCRRQYTSPITVTYHGGNTVTAINAYYLCGASLLLADLGTASTGVGSGKSLADKVAVAQAWIATGNTTAACVTLTGYINEVKAQTGKKIPAATAAALIAQATATRAGLGC